MDNCPLGEPLDRPFTMQLDELLGDTELFNDLVSNARVHKDAAEKLLVLAAGILPGSVDYEEFEHDHPAEAREIETLVRTMRETYEDLLAFAPLVGMILIHRLMKVQGVPELGVEWEMHIRRGLFSDPASAENLKRKLQAFITGEPID